MTADDFTTAAAAEGQARITAMLEVAGASADIRAWFPAGFEKGAVWARDHLAAQEETDAEVEAAARALYDEDINDSVSPDPWPAWEADDNAARSIYRTNARAALAAARAVRQEKR